MTRSDKRCDAIAGGLAAIADLSRADLIERWEAAYGRLPPRGISRRLLEYSAAYSIQVRALGGLKASLQRRLERLDGKGASKDKTRASSSTTRMVPGARLVRDWHGRTHTVDVIEKGFRYAGRDYNSLSQIAREITGARWSGPRFFGL